jgi:cell division septation protein DedD
MIGFCLFLALAAAPPCRGATFYSIQVAASPDKATAEQTSEQMKRMGHHAFVRLETIPGKGQWHRVYVERFGSKAAADKEAAALKSLGLLNECYVRALKDEPEAAISPHRAPRRQENHASGTFHFIHFGSFKEKENAEKEVARLGKNGHKAFYVEESSAGSRWFRTYVGDFADMREAHRTGSRLKEKGVISYFKVISFDRGGDSTAKVTKR